MLYRTLLTVCFATLVLTILPTTVAAAPSTSHMDSYEIQESAGNTSDWISLTPEPNSFYSSNRQEIQAISQVTNTLSTCESLEDIDIALEPETWIQATSNWEIVSLQDEIVVSLPPAWETEMLTSSSVVGYQINSGNSIIQVTRTPQITSTIGAEPKIIEQYRESGYRVQKVSVKGFTAWEILPATPVEQLCREVFVILPNDGSYVRFRLKSVHSAACSESNAFELIVSSLQIPTPGQEQSILECSESVPESLEFLSQGNIMPMGRDYDRQAAINYANSYCDRQTNSDGVYLGGGDGAHFVAHGLCAGGFSIHTCAGQSHSDTRVTNIATQRTYVKNFSSVYSVSSRYDLGAFYSNKCY